MTNFDNNFQPDNPGAERDQVSAALLELMDTPSHRQDFWANLDAQLDRADLERGSSSDVTAMRVSSVRRSDGDSGALQRRNPSPEADVTPGSWFRDVRIFATAAVLLAVSLVTVGFLVNRSNPAEPVDVTVPVTSDDAVSTEDSTEEPADGSADANSDPQPDPIEDAAVDTSDPGTTGPTQTTPQPTTQQPAAFGVPPTDADGSWAIGVGRPVGLSPDGSAALVLSPRPSGESGCEGAPEYVLWRIPFDGSTPELAAPQLADGDPTIGMGRFERRGDTAAWTAGCDGYVTSVALATIDRPGRLSDPALINLAEHVGFDPFEGKLGVLDIDWEESEAERLLVKVGNGIHFEILVFEGSEFVSRASIPASETTFTTVPDEFANGTVRLFQESGLVRVAPDGDSGFVFAGRAVVATADNWYRAVATESDYSGIWTIESTGDDPNECSGQLRFTPFDGSDPTDIGPLGAPAYGLSPSFRATGEDVLFATCDGYTSVYLGDINATGPLTGFRILDMQLWWQIPTVTATDGEPVRVQVTPQPDQVITAVVNEDRSFTLEGPSGFGGLRLGNPRFGFHFDVLPGWTVLPSPTNADGRTITHPSGAEVRVFGTFDDTPFERPVGFGAVSEESKVTLPTLSNGDTYTAVVRRSDWSGSGVPRDFIEVVTAAAERAVVFSASVPFDNPDVIADVEAMIASLDVHAVLTN